MHLQAKIKIFLSQRRFPKKFSMNDMWASAIYRKKKMTTFLVARMGQERSAASFNSSKRYRKSWIAKRPPWVARKGWLVNRLTRGLRRWAHHTTNRMMAVSKKGNSWSIYRPRSRKHSKRGVKTAEQKMKKQPIRSTRMNHVRIVCRNLSFDRKTFIKWWPTHKSASSPTHILSRWTACPTSISSWATCENRPINQAYLPV